MLVQNLLVDDIVLREPGPTGALSSTLYEFGKSRWLSFHVQPGGRELGPMTLLKDEGATDQLDQTQMTSFGERPLHTDGVPTHPVISYRDTWTVPAHTVYALVLPPRFISVHMELKCSGDTNSYFPLQIGVHGQRLFYHALFHQEQLFQIEVRLEANDKEHRKILEGYEVVSGTNQFERLGSIIARRTSPEFWLKLLELGTKLAGKT